MTDCGQEQAPTAPRSKVGPSLPSGSPALSNSLPHPQSSFPFTSARLPPAASLSRTPKPCCDKQDSRGSIRAKQARPPRPTNTTAASNLRLYHTTPLPTTTTTTTTSDNAIHTTTPHRPSHQQTPLNYITSNMSSADMDQNLKLVSSDGVELSCSKSCFANTLERITY